MSFFVVERGAPDGALRVPVPRAFETREAALEALSSAVAAGDAAIDGEVFVVDLGAAVPVLVMPSPVAAAGTGVPEPAREPDVAPPASDAPVYDAWAEAVVSTEADDARELADALKRAATSLEAEGIVAPASIDAVPSDAGDPWEAGPAVVAEPVGAAEADAVAGDALAPGPDAMADLSAALQGLASTELPGEGPTVDDAAPAPDGGTWPWANVTPVDRVDDDDADAGGGDIADVPSAAEADRDLVAETVASLDADSAEEVSLLAPAQDGGEVYVPRPVILGDYDDAVAAEVPAPETTTESDPVADAPVGAWLGGAGSEAAAPASDDATTPGYEGGTELDLGTYTCDDCVYSNTCPKVGQATPADCGSFQWRSE